jgi:hypothetical protein
MRVSVASHDTEEASLAEHTLTLGDTVPAASAVP